MNYARPDPWGPGAIARPGLPDQLGVFLIGVTPAGSALLDHRLFLPESWCQSTREAKDRRDAAHIPDDVTFRTKTQIAADLVRNVAVLGQVELDWVVADSEYGRAGHFLDELELLGQRYVLEVPVTWVFWTANPASSIPAFSGRGRKPTVPRRDAARTVAELAKELPAAAWTALQVREGDLARWCSSSRRSGCGASATASRDRPPGC